MDRVRCVHNCHHSWHNVIPYNAILWKLLCVHNTLLRYHYYHYNTIITLLQSALCRFVLHGVCNLLLLSNGFDSYMCLFIFMPTSATNL